jgi:hypothetical protein
MKRRVMAASDALTRGINVRIGTAVPDKQFKKTTAASGTAAN